MLIDMPFSFNPDRVPGFRIPVAKTPGAAVAEVLQNPDWLAKWPYTEDDFRRMDERDDAIFYNRRRLVYHNDKASVAALTQYYAQHFQNGQDILDLCSSWVSHYPEDWEGGNVVGLGMNEIELSKNPVLTDYVVKDLNADPVFPFDDASFDKITCAVSIEYLIKPLEVFPEIGRVLRPGGECIFSMCNNFFVEKAPMMWLETDILQHAFIVGSYIHYSNMFEQPTSEDISPDHDRSDWMFIVKATRKQQ